MGAWRGTPPGGEKNPAAIEDADAAAATGAADAADERAVAAGESITAVCILSQCSR